jgi:hypothetical protein
MIGDIPEWAPGTREGFEAFANPLGVTSPLREEEYDSDICRSEKKDYRLSSIGNEERNLLG